MATLNAYGNRYAVLATIVLQDLKELRLLHRNSLKYSWRAVFPAIKLM
jgi:hypothetical protein